MSEDQDNESDEDSDDEIMEEPEVDELDEGQDPFDQMRHILDAPDDIVDNDIDMNDASESNTASPLLLRRYSSQAIVEHYLAVGVPILAVITNLKGKQRIGVVVAKCNEWWSLPLRIGDMKYDDPLGLHTIDERRVLQTRQKGLPPTNHIQVLNYITLLSALWLEVPSKPYDVLTMEGEHLTRDSSFE